VVFLSTFFLFNQASLRNFFDCCPPFSAFVVPAARCAFWPRSSNIGSYETLLTLPVGFNDVIIGKFAAGVAFVAAMLIPTLVYPVTVAFLGALDWGRSSAVISAQFFLGAAFSPSACSPRRSPAIRSSPSSSGWRLLQLTLVDQMVFFVPRPFVGVLSYLAADVHFQNVAKGIIDTGTSSIS